MENGYDYGMMAKSVIGAEKDMLAATEKYMKTLEDTFKDLSLDDMVKFLDTATKDRDISCRLFSHCISAYKETHPRKSKVEIVGVTSDGPLPLEDVLEFLMGWCDDGGR